MIEGLALGGGALLALTLCWLVAAPFWLAELLVYGPPLLYLCCRWEPVRSALPLGFLVKAVAFCAIFYTYVGVRYQGWTGPSAVPHLLGVPLEQALWGALVIPLTIAVNQRFFVAPAATRSLPGARRLIYLLFACGLAIAVIPSLRSLMDGYVYLKIGIFLYPLVFLVALRLGGSVARELLLTCVVFFTLHLGFELLAMHHGYWGFEGEYVAWAEVAGYRFPLEELVFILLLASPAVVAVHAVRYSWKGIDRPRRPR